MKTHKKDNMIAGDVERKARILVGTCREANYDWIREKKMYNLPLSEKDSGEGYKDIDYLLVYARGKKAICHMARYRCVVDAGFLSEQGYARSGPAHAVRYALFDLGDLVPVDSLFIRSNVEVFIASTRWTGIIDRDFYKRPLPDCGGSSIPNVFEKLRPLLHRHATAVAFNSRQTDFLSILDESRKGNARFPPPKEPKFTFIDLFAGIGGFRIAMQRCGGQCVFSSEWDEAAQKTYEGNFGEVPVGDITKQETTNMIPNGFDVLCAGFPCQAFSIAGQQRGFEDTRGTLFFNVARIISDRRPKAFFLENVKNLTTHDEGRTYKTIKRVLTRDLGYRIFDQVMSPHKYANIPQNRERIFIVGFDPKQVSKDKIDDFRFPPPIPLTTRIADFIDPNVHDRRFYYGESFAHYGDLVANMTRRDTIYQWRRQYVRENKNNLCPTLTANMGTGGHNVPLIVTDDGFRKLTPRECLNFQGFPAEYEFPNIPQAKCYKQAGNSVVVPLILRVAERLAGVML